MPRGWMRPEVRQTGGGGPRSAVASDHGADATGDRRRDCGAMWGWPDMARRVSRLRQSNDVRKRREGRLRPSRIPPLSFIWPVCRTLCRRRPMGHFQEVPASRRQVGFLNVGDALVPPSRDIVYPAPGPGENPQLAKGRTRRGTRSVEPCHEWWTSASTCGPMPGAGTRTATALRCVASIARCGASPYQAGPCLISMNNYATYPRWASSTWPAAAIDQPGARNAPAHRRPVRSSERGRWCGS